MIVMEWSGCWEKGASVSSSKPLMVDFRRKFTLAVVELLSFSLLFFVNRKERRKKVPLNWALQEKGGRGG